MTSRLEWLIDASGCGRAGLSDLSVLRSLCGEIIAELELHIVGEPLWHQFPEPSSGTGLGGVTGMYLLSESHLTCHTFPEIGLATFNLYCCRPLADWPWEERLSARLGAKSVLVQRLSRGGNASASTGIEAVFAANGKESA